MKIKNILTNIKDGAHMSKVPNKSGFELARHLADEQEKKTGNKCLVERQIDYVDQFNGRDREHFSFDVIELLN